MKSVLLVCSTLFFSGLQAQAPNTSVQNAQQSQSSSGQKSGEQITQKPSQDSANLQTAVPLADEPHHRLILQNDYVRVFDVQIAALDATLLHQHDLPYIYVCLGAANFMNAVTGQSEVRVALPDGTVRYSPGHFSHLVRTDSGIPFHNITIELVRPQTSLRNLCDKVMDGPQGACSQSEPSTKRTAFQPFEQAIPYFETDEVRLDLIHIGGGEDYTEESPRTAALLVALSNANLDVSLAGNHAAFLHQGDIIWLPAGVARKVVDFLGTKSSFFVLSFKDSATTKP